jgi:beta-lactamase class D/imidazolonepropionase-like amidohydrolase
MRFVSMARVRWVAVTGVAAMAAACASFSTNGGTEQARAMNAAIPDRDFAVVGVRVFDGERTHDRASVLVRDGRIEAVGERVRVPRGVATIDGAGLTLMPGLIDSHVHAFSSEALEQAARFGVTTVLDMFTDPAFAARARRSTGEQRHADLRSAGYLATAPGGHGTQYGLDVPTVGGPGDADAWTEARAEEGSDFIKIVWEDGAAHGRPIPTLDEPTIAALVRSARARDLLAVAHIGRHDDAVGAIRAGVDGLVHLFFDRDADPALIAAMADRGVFAIPTLTVLESVVLGASGTHLLGDERLLPFVSVNEEAGLAGGFGARPNGEALLANALSATGALHAAGVRILAGSDAPNPGTGHGASMHRELELLVRAGLTPSEALRAATSAPAAAFRLTDRGRIAPGLRADLILVRGDPSVDVGRARDIVAVWTGGYAVDREAARLRIAEQREARDRVRRAAADRPGLISDFADGSADRVRRGVGGIHRRDGRRRVGRLDGGRRGGRRPRAPCQRLARRDRPGRWSGVMFSPGAAPMQPTDLKQWAGIAFRARGDGRDYELMVFTRAGGMAPATRAFPTAEGWSEVLISWDDLGVRDASGVLGLVWTAAGAAGEFEFWIDDVRMIPADDGTAETTLVAASRTSGNGPDAASAGRPAALDAPEIAAAFAAEDSRGAMLVRRLSDGREWVYGGARVDSGFLPASTFKILNAGIALQTGAVSGPDEAFAWDGVQRQFDGWNRDHTLASAMAASAVPVYQELARRIGAERMREWLVALEYGNADIGGGLERFWLDGALRTSARDQVDALARLAAGATPLRAEVVDHVERMILQESGDGWSLHAKTGWAFEAQVGWWVGWTGHRGETYVFALNMPITDSRLDPPRRARIGRAALRAVGALP